MTFYDSSVMNKVLDSKSIYCIMQTYALCKIWNQYIKCTISLFSLSCTFHSCCYLDCFLFPFLFSLFSSSVYKNYIFNFFYILLITVCTSSTNYSRMIQLRKTLPNVIVEYLWSNVMQCRIDVNFTKCFVWFSRKY